MKKNTLQTPKRAQYEAQNPLFAVRTTKEFMTHVEAMERSTNKSRRELLYANYRYGENNFNAAVSKQVDEKIQILKDEIFQDGKEAGRKESSVQNSEKLFDQGDRFGFDRAKQIFAIVVPCEICKNEIAVHADSEEAARFREYLIQKKLSHPLCFRDWWERYGKPNF